MLTTCCLNLRVAATWSLRLPPEEDRVRRLHIFLNTFIIGITSLEKPFMRFAYQNVSVKIVSSQKGLSLVLGHINTLLDRSDPSDSRLRLLWAATATSGTALLLPWRWRRLGIRHKSGFSVTAVNVKQTPNSRWVALESVFAPHVLAWASPTISPPRRVWN